ncbi:hypothetical protein [Duncaniella dubosii]|jgi:hypothetical protein|uniref:DUF2993 domain-containing protein n=1 Tax=Duncaniella dubosii TaxID=2518971 RepID=A0A4P7W504_9BACT|nr:hypothetical protein [Duncaniella dubosii]QCD43129.1 hypothetical protein E7747_13095 [Duncaniella dubosii]
MKNFITSACLFAALALVSCNDNARLASEVQGAWTGTPENFTDNSVVTATILETFDFVSDGTVIAKGSHGGSVVIAGMITASTQVVADAGLVEPLSLTATAKSTISGTWTVIDDDEIALSLNLQSLAVDVDPSTLVVEGNVLTGNDTPKIDSIRPSVAATIGASMKRALENRYASFRHLDDVKVKGPLLKFEIGKMDCVFTRQGEAQ